MAINFEGADDPNRVAGWPGDSEMSEPATSDPSGWVDEHGDYLQRFALARVGDSAVAEDLVQETFLAALKSRGQFAGRSSERTWFTGILKRKIVDFFRRRSREPVARDPSLLAEEADQDFADRGSRAGSWKSGRRPADWLIDPTDPVEQQEFWRYLQQCLAELDSRAAEAFLLRELAELNSDQICNELQVRPTNLRVILHRARKQLRRCLELNWIGIPGKNK